MENNQNTAAEWQFAVPDADDRRGRHVIAVVGSCEHSGIRWHRFHTGLAATVYKGRQGYKPEDITAIEIAGGMDRGTGLVVAWMDFVTPLLPLERQGYECALPEPLRRSAVA